MSTATIARDRGVIAASTAAGSRLSVARIDVGEHGSRALEDEAVRRRDERDRGGDDLVALPQPEPVAEQMEAGGSARHGHGVRRTDALREELLEAVDHRPQREPAGPQHLEHELLLALADIGLGERDPPEGGAHASAGVRSGMEAYSSQWAQRSPPPRTVSRYAFWSLSVTGPGGPIS